MSASEETPGEVQITRDMLHYVKDASQKYKEDLCQQRQEKENERKPLKWKIVGDENKQIKAKYCILQGEIEDLTISAVKLAWNVLACFKICSFIFHLNFVRKLTFISCEK